MANCPNCGSSDITLTKNAPVTWGSAFAGDSETKVVNCCLNCGTNYKAEVLYQILQWVKSETGKEFDLTYKQGSLSYICLKLGEIQVAIECLKKTASLYMEQGNLDKYYMVILALQKLGQ